MQINSIVKGDSVELEIRHQGKAVSFKSEVSFVMNDSLLIQPIKANGQTIGFSDQCQISIFYLVDGKLFIWTGASIKLVRYNGAIYHRIEVTGEGKPYNRRYSFRLYLGEEMPIYINTPEGPSAIKVLIKDISETGLGFVSKEDLALRRTIRFKLVDSAMTLNLSGLIVRKEALNHLGSYLYGCRFTEKNEVLGKYIIKKQSEALRKKNGSLYEMINER